MLIAVAGTQGHMHTEKMKEANRRAAELTLQLT